MKNACGCCNKGKRSSDYFIARTYPCREKCKLQSVGATGYAVGVFALAPTANLFFQLY
jgi:hypothetical protein